MTRISYESARSSSSVQAFSMMGRSDSDPIRIPTSGAVASRPGIRSSISAGVGVGLGMSGSSTARDAGNSEPGFLLGRPQRDVAADVLAFEFDLLRPGQGALAREVERRGGCGDAEHAT